MLSCVLAVVVLCSPVSCAVLCVVLYGSAVLCCAVLDAAAAAESCVLAAVVCALWRGVCADLEHTCTAHHTHHTTHTKGRPK